MTNEEFLTLDIDYVVSDAEAKHYYAVCDTDAMGTAERGKAFAVYAAQELDEETPKHIRIDAQNAESWNLAGRIIRR